MLLCCSLVFLMYVFTCFYKSKKNMFFNVFYLQNNVLNIYALKSNTIFSNCYILHLLLSGSVEKFWKSPLLDEKWRVDRISCFAYLLEDHSVNWSLSRALVKWVRAKPCRISCNHYRRCRPVIVTTVFVAQSLRLSLAHSRRGPAKTVKRNEMPRRDPRVASI